MPPLVFEPRCLVPLLRPLVRFCVRHSIHIQDFVACAKRLFVEAAQAELPKEERKNQSRISLMTGLQRTDVAELLRERAAPPEPFGLIGRLIGQWTEDRRFTTQAEKPRVLKTTGKKSEFASLVRSVTSSVHPSSVLLEMERLGVVERSGNCVTLRRNVLSLQKDSIKGFELLGADLDTLIRAAEENLTGEPRPWHLHIRTEYDNLVKRRLPVIQRWLIDQGNAQHREAREYLSRQDKGIAPPEEGAGEEGGGFAVLVTVGYTKPPRDGGER